jgi:hypothetical protein
LAPENLATLTHVLGFVGDKLSKLGRRHRQRHSADIGESHLNPGIGEAGIDLPVV